MTFTKPRDLKYTDLCIYIDNHIYDPDCDEEKCFEYMYHLFYILSVKGKMFLTAADYDGYALYGATQLFLRYRRGQKEGSTLKPIKSCLNYIKKVLYPLKVNYQKTTFAQVFPKEDEDGVITKLAESKAEEVRRDTNALMRVEYTYCLSQIAATVRLVIEESPYAHNPAMSHNLYLSCLLTLLKTITMNNKNKARIENKENRKLPIANLADKIYAEESKDSPVTFHLDKSMGNYIKTLVARCKREITKDLRYIIGSYELPDSVMKDILMQPLENIRDE